MDKYEWSDSGKRLLRLVEQEIEKHGGVARLVNAIESEWTKGYRFTAIRPEPTMEPRFKWTDTEVELLINNRDLSLIDLWYMMPHRSIAAVKGKIGILLKKGLIDYKRPPYETSTRNAIANEHAI